MKLSFDDILKRNFPIISDEYKAFAEEKSKCRQCPIYEDYKTVGMSEGNAENPTFMFVGECPGKDEVEAIRPFFGLAGQRLRSELRKHPAVFRKDTVLISNIIPCRPENNQFPKNTKLVKSCFSMWLEKEILLVRPKVIIALGNPALKYLRDDWGITANRGKWKFLPDFQAWSFATFHPSYVIRSERAKNQHIVDQFEMDIKTVATNWSTVIDSDERMSMSSKEWEREKALHHSIKLGIING